MKQAQIVQIVREEYLDDVADMASSQDAEQVYAATTRQLIRWCGEAEREACRRGDCRLIYDEDTQAVCAITLVAGQRGYMLHDSILRLDRVLYSAVVIEKTTEDALCEFSSGWRAYVAGVPVAYYVKGRTLYLDRAASAAMAGETLSLQVWREPLVVPKENESPEIPSQYHEHLAHWMVYRAKSRMNSETYSAQGAKLALDMFGAAFGRPLKARVLERLLESPGFLQHSVGRSYADHHRSMSSDWMSEE